MEQKIIFNSIKTPDGTVLKSRNRHDYVTYLDENGETYMVDGGFDYLKRSTNVIPATEMSLYENSDFDLIRNGFDRYNPRTSKYETVSEMSDEWLSNIIPWFRGRPNHIDDSDFPLWIFLTEYRDRKLDKLI